MASIFWILQLIRVRQQYKNLIIMVPLIFSLNLFDAEKVIHVFFGFVVLVLITGSMYIRNDIHDKKSDQMHPQKKIRPIASGLISEKRAAVISVIMAAAGLALGFYLDLYFGIICIAIVLNMEVYSIWISKVIFADVMLIGLNFVFRVIAGLFLVQSDLSPWIILGVFCSAVFLGLTPRRPDLDCWGGGEGKENHHKPVLLKYSTNMLKLAQLTAGITLTVIYLMYSIYNPHSDLRLLLTVPMVIFVVSRCIFTSRRKAQPVQFENILADKQSVAAMLTHAVVVVWLLYY